MHVFYIPLVQSNELILSEEESKHCIRVLRLKEQDTVYLIDGVGGFYFAHIIEANPKKCKVFVYQKHSEFGKRNYNITIAIAPTKNIERFEWFLEKATEIGIDKIIPLVCHQSERKIIKSDRLNKIIVEAVKQSKQAYLPVLTDICTYKAIVSAQFHGKKLIAHCADDQKLNLKNAIEPGENALIMIGPEGDFSQEEIKLALDHGFKAVSLGNNRLRTETAGVVACHTIALLNQV
jgi:16S rRNA (uracil1498-N3)-methyltransferase